MRLKSSAVLITLSLLLFIPPYYPVGGGEMAEDPSNLLVPHFTNVTASVGLSGVRGNFFSWGDYNRDGYPDLLVDGKRLFRNSGPPSFYFREVTEQAGIYRPVNSGTWGDYDNDGYLDIYCPGGRLSNDHPTYPDVLWHNNGDGTFTDVTEEAGGVTDTLSSAACGWADFDRDGDLDLYVANYENSSLAGYPDVFWINNGDGTFINGTLLTNLSEDAHPYPGRGVAWGDFNNDFWPDLYIANYRLKRNYLYENMRNGTFREIARDSDAAGHRKERMGGAYYGHSVGACWGDYDNDGDLDLWVTNLAHKDIYRGPLCDDSMLLENAGGNFRDRRSESGIPVKKIPGAIFDGDELFVGCAWGDVNNDGYLDIFLPQIYNDVDYAYSYLYLGRGDGTFTDVTDEAGVRVWDTYGSALCDYDLDGDLDLITGGKGSSSSDAPHEIHLFRNEGPSGNFLEVSLVGRDSNTYGVGARIEVRVGDLTLIREVNAGRGAHGQQDGFVQHFGLGSREGPATVKVYWPSGRVTLREIGRVNRRVEIVEPASRVKVEIKDVDVSDLHPLLGENITVSVRVENSGDTALNYLIFTAEFMKVVRREEILREVQMGETIYFNFTMSIPPILDLVGWRNLTLRTLSLIGEECEERVQLMIREKNLPPEAKLTVQGRRFYTGEKVTFNATQSSDDTEYLEFLYDFGDGEREGWTVERVVTHVYRSAGNYTVRLIVRDEDGALSLPATVNITVYGGEGGEVQPPEARIILITPNPAREGEEVTFKGEGVPAPGYQILQYRWVSSIDGLISYDSTFTRNDLSVGLHRIEFTVMDSRGVWSDPAVEYLTVEEGPGTPWVKITSPGDGEVVSGMVTVKGTSGPEGLIDYVQVSLDGGAWQLAGGAPEWRHTIDTFELENGPHLLSARAFNGVRYSPTVSITFYVNNTVPEGVQESMGGEKGGGTPPIYTYPTLILLIAVLIIIARRFLSTSPSPSQNNPQ